MPFERPTLTQIVSRIQSDIQTSVTNGGTLLRRSVLKIIGKVFAGVVHLLYSYLGFQSEQLFVSTADVEGLEKHADQYGINRSAAKYAVGNATATGTNGTTIPASTELQSADGQKYLVDSEVTIAGSTTIALTAYEAGLDGNQDASTTLTFVSPIVGVNSQATVDSSGLTGGADEQTDEELRAKVLRRRQTPPYGGCQYDYENWMLEYTGVTRSWVFPSYNGAGTVGCAFVMDNSTPYIPNAATIALVRAYLVEHEDPATGRTVGIPVTAEQGLFMITLSEQDLDLSISIYPNTTTIQTLIEAEIEDLILRKGGPGETIYLNDIQSALSNVYSLQKFTLVSPITNISILTTQIYTLGTITYSDY